jgi:hypothetical protein
MAGGTRRALLARERLAASIPSVGRRCPGAPSGAFERCRNEPPNVRTGPLRGKRPRKAGAGRGAKSFGERFPRFV